MISITALIGYREVNYPVGFEGAEFFSEVAVSREVLVAKAENCELSIGFIALLILICDVDNLLLSEGGK